MALQHFKILVVGEIGTGKTAIIRRFVHHSFSSEYKSTIGVDLAVKVINWENNTQIALQFWDIAGIFYCKHPMTNCEGQERYASLSRVFYRDAVAAFIVYDVTRKSSFDAVLKWKADIDNKVFLYDSNIPIPCVLLANKSDLVGWIPQSEAFLERFCVQNNFVSWFPTSAKKNINIEEAVMCLVRVILKNQNLDSGESVKDLDIIRLTEKDKLKGLTFRSCICV